MNVVSIISYPFLPAKSGGQKLISLFYKYFSKYHEVTCVSTKKNDPGLAEGYVLLNGLSDSRLRYINPFYFFYLRRIIRERNASHLIIEHPYYGWLGILLKKFCGVRLIVHSHNIEANRWKSLGKWWWRILWIYEKYTHRHADYNFFITDSDKAFAIREFGLRPDLCLIVTYGIEISSPPQQSETVSAKDFLRRQYSIPPSDSLLFFNGAFRYGPNLEALENLLFRVNPLLQEKGFAYRILICGIEIPEKYFRESFPGVRVIGFTNDLETFLKGCDAFLNPVILGGGIKTKLVEALGYNLNSISTESGSTGIDQRLCNGKLVVCADHDWNFFAESTIRQAGMQARIPPAFYDHFYWENIARRAAEFIEVR